MQKKIASEKKIKGKAMVMFTVNTKGKVSDIKVVKKDNEGAHHQDCGGLVLCQNRKGYFLFGAVWRPVAVFVHAQRQFVGSVGTIH